MVANYNPLVLVVNIVLNMVEEAENSFRDLNLQGKGETNIRLSKVDEDEKAILSYLRDQANSLQLFLDQSRLSIIEKNARILALFLEIDIDSCC